MKASSLFSAPEAVEMHVQSKLSPQEMMGRLDRAIRERRYSTPDRNSWGFLRLGGYLAGETVVLTATPYVMPRVRAGFGAMAIELRGELAPTDTGTELRGLVSAPFRLTALDWLILGVAAIFLGFVVVENRDRLLQTLGLILVPIGVSLPIWIWIIRHNQRMALRNVPDLSRVIAALVSDLPGDVARSLSPD